MPDLLYRRADVYRNLHLGKVLHGWSVRVSGIVADHSEHVLMKDVVFVVGEVARQTVIRTKCRTVHAFVRGPVCLIDHDEVHRVAVELDFDWTRISYDPFKHGHFYRCDTNSPVSQAEAVWFNPTGCYAMETK